MTWDELVELEPELAVLAADIANEPPLCGVCCLWAWFGVDEGGNGYGFKSRMFSLVGYGRAHPGSGLVNGLATDHGMPLGDFLEAMEGGAERCTAWLASLPAVDADRERFLRTSDAYATAYRHLFDAIPVLPPGAPCPECDVGADY